MVNANPIPWPWQDHGVPPAAFAVFAEGGCPVDRSMLNPGTVRVLGEEHAAGWCEKCAAWWYADRADLSLYAVYHVTSRDPADAAGWRNGGTPE